jgi:hypothetical protein
MTVFDLVKIEVTLPDENEELKPEMVDHSYWKVPIIDATLDDLLADYE